MPDEDGTAVFKKERLVPQATLRYYINSAIRYEELKKTGIKFSEFASAYWKQYPKDRIMQLHSQALIQAGCEQVTSERVVMPHYRKET